jgi:hypothetical protein
MNSDQTLKAVLSDLTEAVTKAFQAPSLPAFILLYATIDILSSLTRPMNQTGTSRAVFKDWVTKYMLGTRTLDWNANDVYGARCGILHTYSIESDQSRTNKAKPLVFISNTDERFFFVGQKSVNPRRAIRVELHEFLRAFSDATRRFEMAIQSDVTLKKMVLHHSKNLAFHATVRL